MKQRTASRLAWSLLGLFVVLAAAGWFLQGRNGSVSIDDYVSLATFVLVGVFGAFIASRRPENPIGWIFCTVAFVAAVGFFGFEYGRYGLVTEPGALPAARILGWVGGWTWIPALGILGTFLLLLFPDGHLPSPRWRPVAWATGILLALLTLAVATLPGPIEGLGGARNPFGLGISREAADAIIGFLFLFVTVMTLVSAASMIVRFRRARGEERLQLKWFTFAAVFAAVGIFVGDFLPLSDDIGTLVFTIAVLGLPATAAVAIAKYRLYDIDVVINKTVVLGALVAFISAVYVAIVVGIGALVGSGGNLVLSILATAVIAVAFQPARERARHLANRLVYGRRASPYEVLSEFSDRLAGAYSTQDVLPRMAQILGAGTGAERARVWLRVGGELRSAAGWPEPDEANSIPIRGDELPAFPDEHAVEVRHQGELLGALSVVMPANDPIDPVKAKLVQDLASQAGLVLRNVRLIEELRASRQRLVAAQDEERRKLERDIHDGAQQQLVALAVQLRLVEQLAGKDPVRERNLLIGLQAAANEALEDLRDLARGIYPPLLADKGLAAALESQARKAPLPVTVEPDGIGRYTQDVESAVYFCCLEALNNVAKYAQANRAEVRLSHGEGVLRFEVRDDGRGFDPAAAADGTGLQGMTDRLDAIGGAIDVRSAPGRGTTIVGSVPVRIQGAEA
jgi:signal transduction histidine kinase